MAAERELYNRLASRELICNPEVFRTWVTPLVSTLFQNPATAMLLVANLPDLWLMYLRELSPVLRHKEYMPVIALLFAQGNIVRTQGQRDFSYLRALLCWAIVDTLPLEFVDPLLSYPDEFRHVFRMEILQIDWDRPSIIQKQLASKMHQYGFTYHTLPENYVFANIAEYECLATSYLPGGFTDKNEETVCWLETAVDRYHRETDRRHYASLEWLEACRAPVCFTHKIMYQILHLPSFSLSNVVAAGGLAPPRNPGNMLAFFVACLYGDTPLQAAAIRVLPAMTALLQGWMRGDFRRVLLQKITLQQLLIMSCKYIYRQETAHTRIYPRSSALDYEVARMCHTAGVPMGNLRSPAVWGCNLLVLEDPTTRYGLLPLDIRRLISRFLADENVYQLVSGPANSLVYAPVVDAVYITDVLRGLQAVVTDCLLKHCRNL